MRGLRFVATASCVLGLWVWFGAQLGVTREGFAAATPPSVRSHFLGTNWAKVQYPGADGIQDCGVNGTTVGKVSYARPAPETNIAVVLLACNVTDAGQFSMLYAFKPGMTSSQPDYVQTLLSVGSFRWESTSFSLRESKVSMAVAGFKGHAALCCPNIFRLLRWSWSEGRYRGLQPVHLTPQKLENLHLGGSS
jgi:hypothetical protein